MCRSVSWCTIPFVGSGSTIVAAERQGRACYSMEMDAAYCDVAVRRWEDHTAQKAERVAGFYAAPERRHLVE